MAGSCRLRCTVHTDTHLHSRTHILLTVQLMHASGQIVIIWVSLSHSSLWLDGRLHGRRNFKDTNVVFTGHFCLRRWSNFVGFKSGQKQSVKLLQNMVCSTIQHPPPPTPTHCLYIYTVHLVWKEGEGWVVREKVKGQKFTSVVPSSLGATVHKLDLKYQPWVNVSPVYKIVKHNAAKSVNRSILKKGRHIGFGVFIVHSSMNASLHWTITQPWCPPAYLD